jgi:hypothetical protein
LPFTLNVTRQQSANELKQRNGSDGPRSVIRVISLTFSRRLLLCVSILSFFFRKTEEFIEQLLEYPLLRDRLDLTRGYMVDMVTRNGFSLVHLKCIASNKTPLVKKSESGCCHLKCVAFAEDRRELYAQSHSSHLSISRFNLLQWTGKSELALFGMYLTTIRP